MSLVACKIEDGTSTLHKEREFRISSIFTLCSHDWHGGGFSQIAIDTDWTPNRILSGEKKKECLHGLKEEMAMSA
jgi:hypothetical protein